AGTILSGVSVTEKGTADITQTDANGDFTITVTGANPALVFTALGFDTKEVNVSGKAILNVQLIQATSEPEEVVVTAYGATKKKSLTASVQREAKAYEILQGKVAGIAIRGNASYPSPAAKQTRNLNY